MASMNVGYIIKLERSYMDAIQELLPLVYGLAMRQVFDAKIMDHNLDLGRRQNFIMLLHLVYEEINGHRMSTHFIEVQTRRYLLDRFELPPKQIKLAQHTLGLGLNSKKKSS